ncbi:MAG: ChbG/HpnK family deacetylase [Planctomycetes bacterium]|nr:ChbG/HpnK family deacetylase [Planctomycetota bacterium]
MRTVVFVADDLGVSEGVNRGIGRAAAAGIVREASLCVTGAAVDDGLRCARDHGIGTGLHFSLTLGRALAGPIRGLTDRTGAFLGLSRTLLAATLRRIDRAAIAREFGAQLAALRDRGVAPTHVNGHHHVHVMPVVRDVVLPAIAAAGIGWTRLPREVGAGAAALRPTLVLLSAFGRRAAGVAKSAGLRALPFVGTTTEACDDFARRAARVAARLPATPVEWMVHPHEPDAAMAELDPSGHRRPHAGELAFLTDRAAVTALGIRSARYADLGPDAAVDPRGAVN